MTESSRGPGLLHHKSIHRRRHVKHLAWFIIITGVLAVAVAFLFSHVDLIPRQASVERQYIDSMVKILFSIAGVVFVIIVSLLVYSLLFFRQKRGDMSEAPQIRGYGPLEVAWTVIPLIIVTSLGAYGGIMLGDMTKIGPPPQPLQINVTAARFSWQFEYPDAGVTSFELHMPVNQQVVFHIQSKDVIHSFWIPDMGPKQDAVPGITTELRLTPNKIGQYAVECSQLCGWGHSIMLAPVYVTSMADYQKWVQSQPKSSAQGQ